MKSKSFLSIAFAFLLAAAMSSCSASSWSRTIFPSPTASTTKTGAPSPSPASCSTTSSASPEESPSAAAYSKGDKPFASLRADDVERIRMIVYSDAQPPYFPRPFKDATSPQDLQALMLILNGVEIKAKTDQMHIPVGSTGYFLLINRKDGTVQSVCLYGDYNFTTPDNDYEIATLPHMDAVFESLSGRTRLLPNTSDTLELENSCLFEMDGWKYYFEPDDNGVDGMLVRENVSGDVEKVYKHADVIHPAVFRGQSRIVLVQDQGTDSRVDYFVILSIKPDGSGLKTMKAPHGTAETPMWDEDSLYYVGWSQGLTYPRPLYRVDENLTKMEKTMDVPGPLLTVRGGSVYCLSEDLKHVVCLPDGGIVSSFDSSVEHEEYAAGKWVLYESGGNIWYWTVEAGAVAVTKH